MEHIGMDLGKKESQIAIITEAGEPGERGKCLGRFGQPSDRWRRRPAAGSCCAGERSSPWKSAKRRVRDLAEESANRRRPPRFGSHRAAAIGVASS